MNTLKKLNAWLFALKAVFVWLVAGSFVRRKYRRCIERDEIFYVDEELGG